ncbi:hypothetical protein [Natronoglycomyces albus]|uniref:Uncharacterized protein n=1 Tax=Natronoglycomyces albus TaxID=2811108 RepID=A0A895XJH4_9ACTN|nr:hypothetical protein [Natronoglycomyces albus]QSB03962.1 hypothetical protein JQS30_09000 [Natronoglycomyces albus]
MSRFVALNGVDGVGKTTQARLMLRRAGPVLADAGRLDEYDARWGKLAPDLSRWWFETSSLGELAGLLADSYIARHDASVRSPVPVVVDRGVPMLEASLAATIAVRTKSESDVALDHARELLNPWRDRLQQLWEREHSVLLTHSDEPKDCVAVAIGRQESTTVTYERYLAHLCQIMCRQQEENMFTQVINTEGKSVVQVQGELREGLRAQGIHVENPWYERPLHIVALGGLSESGKSTAGAQLAHRHGFVRFKMGYLMDVAATRHGIARPYDEPAPTQAELVTDEVDRWLSAHHYQHAISIESLHSYDLALQLQKYWGPKLSTVYVDATEELRRHRSLSTDPHDVEVRDQVKKSRGADRIRHIADLRIGNNASQAHLGYHVARLANSTREKVRPRLTTVEALGLPATETQAVSEWIGSLTAGNDRQLVDLIAVTGSAGRTNFRTWWSDIDLLLIGTRYDMGKLLKVTRRLRRQLGNRHVGLTFLKPAEIECGALPSRVTHALRQISNGATGVQWRAENAVVPLISEEIDREATWADAQQTAMELRRALVDESTPRVLFKRAALLAKKVLVANGTTKEDDQDALRDYCALYSRSHPAELFVKARVYASHSRSLAETVLNAWSDIVDENGGRM